MFKVAFLIVPAFALLGLTVPAAAQTTPSASLPPISPTPIPAVTALASRLDLERYKATIKGLTQFGDRRQGTERNRRAVDWIEAQLRSYGCATARLTYVYDPPARQTSQATRPAEPAIPRAVGGGRPRGVRTPTGVNTDPLKQPNEALRALNAEPAANGSEGTGVLHEGRYPVSERDVHRQRAHGRPRLGRGRE